MKSRIITLLLLIIPLTSAYSADLDLRNQILEREIERLTQERDTKYEALKKCESTTQGFKIAGITTLVATGVGVYGNIKLAQSLKGSGGGSGGGGGKNGNMQSSVTDNRPQNEKDCEGVRDLLEQGLATQQEVDETCG